MARSSKTELGVAGCELARGFRTASMSPLSERVSGKWNGYVKGSPAETAPSTAFDNISGAASDFAWTVKGHDGDVGPGDAVW